MEKDCILNIVNLKIADNKLIVETMLKQDNMPISEDIKICLESKNAQKHYGTTLKSDIRLKNTIEVPLTEGKYTFQIYQNEVQYSVTLLNNRNEEILDDENKYIIFYKKYKIQILENKIIVSHKKAFEKAQYDLFKIKYGLKKYKKLYILRLLKKKSKYYLFNDRLKYADDNAEELFRFINKIDKTFAKKCYFVMEKDSSKFFELKKVGKVLIYGSLKHKLKYINAKVVISSHASYLNNMFNPFSVEEMQIYKDIITKQFVFLQHGITMNDVSNYLNRGHIIADLFITSLKREHQDIKTEKYLYEENQVVCTGLPRFDKLIDNKEKIILIAPTWRTTIAEETNIEKTRILSKI